MHAQASSNCCQGRGRNSIVSSRQIDPTLIGAAFQRLTKYDRAGVESGRHWERPVARTKEYPASLPRIQLHPPETSDGTGLWRLLASRRSVRTYANSSMTFQALSQLLWSAQGVTHKTRGSRFRTAPSAGALHPIETYVAVNNVDDCEPGIYHYDVPEHSLIQLSTGHPGIATAHAALDQDICARAAATFIWTAVVGRCAQKYAQRAYRYIYLDAGHVAANLALAAGALGLGSCQIAALFDDEANALLGIDGEEETTLYMSAVGPLP